MEKERKKERLIGSTKKREKENRVGLSKSRPVYVLDLLFSELISN